MRMRLVFRVKKAHTLSNLAEKNSIHRLVNSHSYYCDFQPGEFRNLSGGGEHFFIIFQNKFLLAFLID